MNRTASPMGAFERYLTLWFLLCIVAGVVFGNLLPGLFGTLASIEFASVNLVVAVLIWAMVACRNHGNCAKGSNNSSFPSSNQKPCWETWVTSGAEMTVPGIGDLSKMGFDDHLGIG